jgi:TolA-binding protein
LHFDGGDPGQALRAWDAYLQAYPAGTFAPEARFNRAVCLLRLGRRAEAKSVLVPLAEGSAFVFGRDRARALLDTMGE